jgi:putative ABC transport system permease protein
MKSVGIVLRNLRRRPLATALTSLSVALGVGLFATVGALREAGERGFHRTAAMCDQVVGAKGSSLQLVLNALYHMGQSPGNVPYSLFEELRATPGVEWAVPVAVGDAYRGHRIVGVTGDLFAHVRLPVAGGSDAPLVFARGAAFDYGADRFVELKRHLEQDDHGSEHGDEFPELARAVIGSETAAATGLTVGSHFLPAHDLTGDAGAAEHAEAECEVVGVLAPTGTPMDRAIYVPIGLYYVIAGHAPTVATPAGGARDPRGLSAIYLRTRAGMHQIRIWRAINDRLDAQSARPSEEVRNLFTLVSGFDRVLRAISALIVLVALAGVMVAIYNTMGARRREFAVYRALGARRRTLLGLVTAESAMIALAGGAFGLLLSALLVSFGASILQGTTGVSVSALPDAGDLWLLAAVTAAGALAGLVPAATAYRTEAARILSANL